MPFKPLKFNKPRMFKRRPRTRKRLPFTKKQAKAIHKIAQQSGEMKQVSATSTSSSITATSDFQIPFPTIVKGDDDDQRIGDSINIKDLHYKVNINSGSANGVMRCYIVQLLKRPESTNETAVVGDVLPNDFFPREEDAVVHYKILYDKIFYVSSASNPNKLLNVRIPGSRLAVKQLEWDTDTGLAIELLKGNIYMTITTLNTTATQITGDCNLRVRYYDS